MSKIYGEMKDQYAAMRQSQACLDAREGDIAAFLSAKDKWVFVGCGSSYAVAQSAALMGQLKLNKNAIALAGGDLLLHAQAYRPMLEGCALIVLSRSGETTEVVRAIDWMRKQGINFSVLSVTCVVGSALSGMSDVALEMPWAFDESVCQTRTVSCLYFACAYALAIVAQNTGRARLLVSFITSGGEAFLQQIEEPAKALAQKDWTHVVVLGDGELSGIAQEGALAFKEICQLPSDYYHLLDVRHGPMVLIGKQTLVIAQICGAEGGLEADLIRDLVQKGATVAVCSDAPFHQEGVVNFCVGQSLDQAVRGLPLINVCQLTAYYKSFLTGANPDAPDGLAAWIQLA